MKIRLEQIYTMTAGLEAICQKQLPIAMTYKFLKLSKSIRAEGKTMEEARQQLVKTYSTDGQKVDDDKVEDFQKEFTELMKQEVEIDWHPISIDSLGDIEMTVAELSQIEMLFTQ